VVGPVLCVLDTAGLMTVTFDHLNDRKSRSVITPLRRRQVYGFCRPLVVGEHLASISECTAAVASWMRSNALQVNADKTEVLWCTTARR